MRRRRPEAASGAWLLRRRAGFGTDAGCATFAATFGLSSGLAAPGRLTRHARLRGPGASGGDYFDLFYATWMTGVLYGLLSLAIGMFLKSNGVAVG